MSRVRRLSPRTDTIKQNEVKGVRMSHVQFIHTQFTFAILTLQNTQQVDTLHMRCRALTVVMITDEDNTTRKTT
jgi:hypothetical protein